MSSSEIKDEDKAIQIVAASPAPISMPNYSTQMFNIPLDPLLFYLRDHELYYTAPSGPRYNEYAIFIDHHEWELSATCSFYQYLKIIKAYQALLQTITMKPILVILPTGYIETCRWFDRFTYWKDYDPCILQFVQKVIPDVHIFPHDYFSYQLQFLQSSTQAQRCIQNTCLQIVHYKVNYEVHCTCQISAHYDFTCTLLHKYGHNAQQIE